MQRKAGIPTRSAFSNCRNHFIEAKCPRRPYALRELEANVLAGVVERLCAEDGIAYGEIAVLFRAFTEVKTYENALRRRIPSRRGVGVVVKVTPHAHQFGALGEGEVAAHGWAGHVGMEFG